MKILISALCLWALQGDPSVSSSPITAMTFSPEADHLLCGTQSSIQVRSWPDLELQSSLIPGFSHIHDLAFSPDGQQLGIAGGVPGELGVLEVWTWPAAERISSMELSSDVIYSIAWRSDGRSPTVVGHDRTVRLDSIEGTPLGAYTGHSAPICAVAFLPSLDLMVSGGLGSSLRVWSTKRGELVRSLDNYTGPLLGLSVQPDVPPTGIPVVASIA